MASNCVSRIWAKRPDKRWSRWKRCCFAAAPKSLHSDPALLKSMSRWIVDWRMLHLTKMLLKWPLEETNHRDCGRLRRADLGASLWRPRRLARLGRGADRRGDGRARGEPRRQRRHRPERRDRPVHWRRSAGLEGMQQPCSRHTAAGNADRRAPSGPGSGGTRKLRPSPAPRSSQANASPVSGADLRGTAAPSVAGTDLLTTAQKNGWTLDVIRMS
jgi:hypothetical protein